MLISVYGVDIPPAGFRIHSGILIWFDYRLNTVFFKIFPEIYLIETTIALELINLHTSVNKVIELIFNTIWLGTRYDVHFKTRWFFGFRITEYDQLDPSSILLSVFLPEIFPT